MRLRYLWLCLLPNRMNFQCDSRRPHFLGGYVDSPCDGARTEKGTEGVIGPSANCC